MGIIWDEKACYRCGITVNLHKHHIFYGSANRALSEKDGCYCTLCAKCHSAIHDPKNVVDVEYKKWLMSTAQKKWQAHYQKTKKEFIERYGKSYEQTY